jgi:hypothetical protein
MAMFNVYQYQRRIDGIVYLLQHQNHDLIDISIIINVVFQGLGLLACFGSEFIF